MTGVKIITIGCLTVVLAAGIPGLAGSEEPAIFASADHAEVISGGFSDGNCVLIRVGDYTFYDNMPDAIATAGLYVVGIFENHVILQCHYNTYNTPGASEGLARDIEQLPAGTLVIAAAKDEPTRLFDQRGQEALYQVGASVGLLNQEFRTSYLCLGTKGMAQGQAIEMVGLEQLHYLGPAAGEHIDFTFDPEPPEPDISVQPGVHEMTVGQSEVVYYIPNNFDPDTAEYFFGIHGAGDWHWPGASHRINQFKDTADIENLVVIAPAFDCIFNWPPVWSQDMDENGNFNDPRIIKDWNLWDFIGLLNGYSHHRTDLKLLEIFDLFNRKLMQRNKFHLYGHSGGGQFVSRFMIFYPELIDKVALGSAGTYAFPRRDMDYPYGLKMDNLEDTFGAQIQADDLKLNDSQLDEKINSLLDLKVLIIVGGNETQEHHPELVWQGTNTLERAINFYLAMEQEHQRQKQLGHRPESDPFRFELHVLPGIGHDTDANAHIAQRLWFAHIPGDFDGNGIVNWGDFAILAGQWLETGVNLTADIWPAPYGDSMVNWADFAVFAGNWLATE